MEKERIKSILESVIFASDGAVSLNKLAEILGGEVERSEVRKCLEELKAEYESRRRGFTLEDVAKGVQFRTVSENADYVKQLLPSRINRLSKPAMEVLSIVAYRQPIIKAGIEQVRGVDCTGVIKKLLELGLIKIIGRKDEPGQPFVYGTTPFFLETFGLSDLDELPPLTDFHELSPEINLPEEYKEGSMEGVVQELTEDVVVSDDVVVSEGEEN